MLGLIILLTIIGCNMIFILYICLYKLPNIKYEISDIEMNPPNILIIEHPDKSYSIGIKCLKS